MQPLQTLAAGAGILLAAALCPRAAAAQGVGPADVPERCRDEEPCVVREFGFWPEGTIHVDAGAIGGIVVRAWDRETVYVRAVVEGLSPDPKRAWGIARGVRVQAGADGVRALAPAVPVDGSWVTTLVLYVPQRSDLDLVTGVGPLSVEGVSGRMSLETRAGPLTLRDVGGDVRGLTHAGAVYVVLAGSRWEGRGLDAETRNGPVTLHLSSAYSAQLQVGTINGPPLRVQVPASVEGRTGWIQARLGSGGAPVRVVTAVGSATLRWTRGPGS